MKLPLNIFQILGVSPGASSNNVLMILDKRLENCPYAGFSQDLLSKRKELLNEYSKILLDNDVRHNIEKNLVLSSEIIHEHIVLPSESYSGAGLVLLLEAGLHGECLTLVSELIHKSLESHSRANSNLSDLSVLMGYATIEQADYYRYGRHYDYAAQILEKGLSLLTTTNTKQQIQEKVSESLAEIMPFRILDLLSKSTEDQARQLGMDILIELVKQRGGLDNESNLHIKNNEFQAFFRQIRYYLTVQEQIDLFKRWSIEGSKTAHFLLGIALIASGFSQRKPQRLIDALEVFKLLNLSDLNPIIAYIYLLLGQVQQAQSLFMFTDSHNQICDGDSLTISTSKLTLGELCDLCRDWLAGDVLEGYRDIEINADLEAYFSDRDVTTFIESQDKNEESTGFLQNIIRPVIKTSRPQVMNQHYHKPVMSPQTQVNLRIPRTRLKVEFSRLKSLLLKKSTQVVLLMVILPLSFTIFANYLHKKEKVTNGNQKKHHPNAINKYKMSTKKPSLSIMEQKSASRLTKKDIIDLLSQWLKIKRDVLSGSPIPGSVKLIASAEAIANLELERNENKERGESLQISVDVIDVNILQESKSSAVVLAKLSYSDSRIGRQGDIIASTPKHVFKKTYRLVNKGQKWKIQ